MTMDFNAASQDFTPATETQTETPFAGIPAWERGKTRSSGAARRSTRSSVKSSSAPLAIAAGVVVLGAVAAVGWYATRPHEGAMAELTPGGPNGAAEMTTTTSSAMAPAGAQVAQATPQAPPVTTKSTTSSTRTTSSDDGKRVSTHVRTVTHRATSPSASDATADVSTTERAPSPQVEPVNPGPAPRVLNLPQTTPVPAPAPQAAPPAAAPAPTVTPPTSEAAPQTAVPPNANPPTATPPSDTSTPPTPPTA
ncbi:MAG: hypothetical protein JSS35_02995 [Proteobacteria bacterium]|nr:hypothetical protein [Pseudomonadota bacterium]